MYSNKKKEIEKHLSTKAIVDKTCHSQNVSIHEMTELKEINKSLKKFEKWLFGFNYECHFTFEKIVNSLDIQEALKIIRDKYELSRQDEQNLETVEYEDFIKDITEKLKYRGGRGAGVKLSEKHEIKFSLELEKTTGLIRKRFNNKETEIFIYPELTTWIFWGFCFILISKPRKEIFLFEGISTD